MGDGLADLFAVGLIKSLRGISGGPWPGVEGLTVFLLMRRSLRLESLAQDEEDVMRSAMLVALAGLRWENALI